MAEGSQGWSEEDEVSLYLWQRAAFDGTSSPPSDTKGRACADSLRMRFGQLEHESYSWQEKQPSDSCPPPHVHYLMTEFLKNYGKAIDDREGINTFAAPVKVLAAGHKNESKEWKSELTFESVMKMPVVRGLLKEKLQIKAVTLPSNSQSSGGHGTKGPQSSSQPHAKTYVQESEIAPYSVFSKSSSSGTDFPYATPGSSSSSSTEMVVNPRRVQDGPKVNGRSSRAKYVDSFCDTGVVRKRRRLERGCEDDGQGEGDTAKDTEGMQEPPSAFVTARDQYVINQRKRFGRGAARGEGRRTMEEDDRELGAAVTTNCYGVSKRSLGTRRVPGSRFVPPVKRGRDDGSGDYLSEEVSRRVFHGQSRRGEGGGGTSKLPLELEGDERLRSIEPRMVELIMNEIMDHGASVQWDDIAGLEFAKSTITEIVVWPMLRPDLFTGLRGPPKGILLFGPPGTGKTLIGKCIASQVNATFFSISASSLTSKWIGEGEKMVRALFAVARCHQPAVIFMDEIDSLLTQRSDTEHESSRRIKTEFLVQLDGATTDADDRLLVIGATNRFVRMLSNRPQEIDEAARRRLVKRLYIPLPESSARKQIVINLMKHQPFSLSEDELEDICKHSDGYSGADMANVCREAAYGPVREAAKTIQHISADEMRPIVHKDFVAAFQVIRPSVSEKDLGLYEEWNRQFGCGMK